MLGDLHIHSTYSNEGLKIFPWSLDSLLFPNQILKRASLLKLKVIAITDHNTLRGSIIAQRLSSNYGVTVVPGIEIRTEGLYGKDILGYGIDEFIKPFQSPEETIDRIHEQGGIAVAAHPFNLFFSLKSKILDLKLDGLETFNAMAFGNDIAKMSAIRLKLGQTGGSDSHFLWSIGDGLTEFPDDCNDIEDLLKAIKHRKTNAYGTKTSKIEYASHVVYNHFLNRFWFRH